MSERYEWGFIDPATGRWIRYERHPINPAAVPATGDHDE